MIIYLKVKIRLNFDIAMKIRTVSAQNREVRK